MKSLLLLTIMAACRNAGPETSPLGTLDAHALTRWQAECSTPLGEQRVCGRFTPDKCDGKFHSLMPYKGFITENEPGSSATVKHTCASEGWGIWTDELDRIVGFCVADAPGDVNSVRMKQFITRLYNEQLAVKIDDYTAGRKIDDSEARWHDWYGWDMVPRPPEMGQQACIEFRLLK